MHNFQSEKFKSMLFCDQRGVPLIMPNIFLLSLNNKRNVYKPKWLETQDQRRLKNVELITERISPKTITECSYELRKFLVWLTEFSDGKSHISVANHHNLPVQILNFYINQVLVLDRKISEKMLDKAVNSLSHYYNYLAYHGFTSFKKIEIENENRGIARENTRKRNVVKYLSARLRAEMYANSHTLREECLLKAGGECGLRTKENMGFLLNDFKVGVTIYQGMVSLFAMLEQEKFKDKQDFKYWLQGKYSKGRRNGLGGKSRWIFIPRDVLERFKLYFEIERPDCDHNSLFVTTSSNGAFGPIREYQATRDFKAVKERVIEKQRLGLFPSYMDRLEDEHTYHILRHSFGTDKFHEVSEENGLQIENVTHMDKPYLVVAELLGHETDGLEAPQTTRKYIRSAQEKIRLDTNIMRGS